MQGGESQKTIAKPDKLITRDGLRDKGIDVSPTTMWRLIRDGKLPRPIKIGQRDHWLEAEIDTWIASLAAARNAKRGHAA